jgi:HlyD family secretion protein
MDARIGEFAERKVAAEDQLKRVDIIAPQSGIVHQLAVHTVGGVIAPGEPVMMIVPDIDKLVVEAKVQPQDIDQIFSGQRAILRFSAFSQKTTPEISGAIERVSADVTVDEKTGVSYYTARIAIADKELARLGAVTLMPGMPVETFITTGERSVASYFIKPFMDQVNRAFRES